MKEVETDLCRDEESELAPSERAIQPRSSNPIQTLKKLLLSRKLSPLTTILSRTPSIDCQELHIGLLKSLHNE